METIAQSVVDGVSYDKTILCTIVDDADRDNGNYRVSDGTSNFWAYSETKTFRNDEQVYVTIPNGDYSLQKLIIGKKKETEEEAFNYVKPFENLMQCTPNLGAYLTYNAGTAENPDYQALNSNYFSLIANGETAEKLASLSNEVDISRYFQGFTRLGIRARFRSMLAAEQVASGNYGLAFIFTTRVLDVVDGNTFVYEIYTDELANLSEEDKSQYHLKDDSATDFIYYILDNVSNNYIETAITPELNPGNIQLYVRKNVYKEEQKIFKLQVEDMIGNPYAFETYFSQEKVFDVSDVQNVTKLEVKFFQDKNFINKTGNAIAASEFANLFCSDVEFYFGYDLSDIKGEYVQLFTYDPLTYESSDNILDNQKMIYLRWAHQDGDKTTVFDQDNLEEWYDEFLDSKVNMPSYEFKLDGSLEQVENRDYYKLKLKYDDKGNLLDKTLKLYTMDKDEETSTYNLTGFFPSYAITKNKQYFRKETIPLKDLWDDNKVYKSFFVGEKDNIVNDNLFNYADGNLFKQRKRVPVILTSEGQLKAEDTPIDQSFVSQHTFYTWDGQFIAVTSILSPSELTSLLNDDKIIYTDTFGSIDEINLEDTTYDKIKLVNNNIQYQKSENKWVNFPQDTYISIYAPIPLTETWNGVAENADLNLALGLGQIYEAQFESIIPTGEASVESGEYVQNVGLFEQVEGDFTYSSNTYYYKKYSLDQFEVRWYRYNLGYIEPDDEYCGVYWERLQPWSEENLTGVEHDNPPFIAKLIPDTVYNATEQIKVILLVIDGATGEITPYYSNVLTFTNKNPVISVPTIQQELALRLKIDDNTNGNYYLYDESNNLIDASQGTQQKSLTVLFDKSNYSSQTRLENASEVTWIFPIENTMIKVDTSTTSGVYSETGNSYAQITTTEALNEYKLYYTIDKTYSYVKGNNTITCNIVKDGEHYSATQELSFGPSGSNGSDYTLVLDLLSSDNMVTVNASTNLVGFIKESDILNTKDIPEDTKDDEGNIIYYRYYLNQNTQTLIPITSGETVPTYYQPISSYDEVLKYLEQGTSIYVYKENEEKYELVSNSIDANTQYYIACEAEIYVKKIIDDDYIDINEVYQDISISKDKLYITFSMKQNNNKEESAEGEEDNEEDNESLEEDSEENNINTSTQMLIEDFLSTNSVYYLDGNFYKPISISDFIDDFFINGVYSNKGGCYIKNVLEQIYGYLNKDNNNTTYNIVNTSTPIETNEILATLYDQSNNKVNGNYTVNWSLDLSEEGIEKYFTFSSETTGLNETVSLLQNQSMDEPKVLCIVTATLTGFGDYDLVAHLPIPLRRNFGITRYQGPTQIIYSATGYPNYYKNEINLFYNNTEGKEQAWPLGISVDDDNITTNFSIISSAYKNDDGSFNTDISQGTSIGKDEEGNEIIKDQEGNYLPSLKTQNSSTQQKIYVTYKNGELYYDNQKITVSKTASENYYSLSKKVYYDNENGIQCEANLISSDTQDGTLIFEHDVPFPTNHYYVIVNKEAATSFYITMVPKSIYVEVLPFGIQYKQKNKQNAPVEFIQPILNIQNRYFSSTINKWDENLSIDEGSNTILAKMIGAGSKDQYNRFSGVILGNWTGNVNQNDGGTFSLADNIGLYGFHEGETSFGFTSAGLGFIGKAGHGRILLDGNNSVITSSNWVINNNMDSSDISAKGNKGLYMKVDDGFILMREGGDSTSFIKLNVLATGGMDTNTQIFSNAQVNTNPYPGVKKDFDYPFVIAKDSKNFTKIGWNGNIYLGGTHAELDKNGTVQQDTGYISLNAAAEKYPFDINNHFAVAWNGALTISTGQITNKTEYAKNVIAIDDQRTFSGGGEDDYKGTEQDKKDEEGKNLPYYNNTLSNKKDEKNQENDVTIYDNSTMIPIGIDNNNATITALAANKVKNPYDYSTLNTSFKGFYATPEGDLYLSRKLVIGSNFSANSDGYLKAHSALFDNCNANVFAVRYLPNGSNATISFGNDNKVIQEENEIDVYEKIYFESQLTDGMKIFIQNDNGEYIEYGTAKLNIDENNNQYWTIGDRLFADISQTLYYLSGKVKQFTINPGASIGEMGWIQGSTGTNYTYNLGFRSKDNCGIVLESQTNIRLESGLQSDMGDTYNNIYLRGGNLNGTLTNQIRLNTLKIPDSFYQTEEENNNKNLWNSGRILVSSSGRLEQRSYSQFQALVGQNIQDDLNTGDPNVTMDYSAQFLMRGAGQPYLNPSSMDLEDGQTYFLKNGLIRLQIPGLVRISMGEDPWGWSKVLNEATNTEISQQNSKLEQIFSINTTRSLNVNGTSQTWPCTLKMYNKLDDLSDQGGYNCDIEGFEHTHITTTAGIYLNTYYSRDMLNGRPLDTSSYHSKFHIDRDIKGSASNNITFKTAGGNGPTLELLASQIIGETENPSANIANLNANNKISINSNVILIGAPNGVFTETGKTGVIIGQNTSSLKIESQEIWVTNAPAKNQHGIYARFA